MASQLVQRKSPSPCPGSQTPVYFMHALDFSPCPISICSRNTGLQGATQSCWALSSHRAFALPVLSFWNTLPLDELAPFQPLEFCSDTILIQNVKLLSHLICPPFYSLPSVSPYWYVCYMNTGTLFPHCPQHHLISEFIKGAGVAHIPWEKHPPLRICNTGNHAKRLLPLPRVHFVQFSW